jgi:hypothetical protein
MITNRDWIVLRAEFKPGLFAASAFVEMHRLQIRDGEELVTDLLKSSEVYPD